MKTLKIIAIVLLLMAGKAFAQPGEKGESEISHHETLLEDLESSAEDSLSGTRITSGDEYLADTVEIAEFDTTYFLSGDPEYNLIRAAEFGQSEVVKMLVERGINVDSRSSRDVTPLMYASQNGDVEIVKYLIGKGANVNARPDNKVTPLIGAARTGHYEVVRLLLEAGARVDARDELGLTALMHAVA